MDCHAILRIFTTDKSDFKSEKLLERLSEAYALLSSDEQNLLRKSRTEASDETNIEWEYLHGILYVLNELLKANLKDENILYSVSQFRVIKDAINISVLLGIKPCLLPGVGMTNGQTPSTDLSSSQKYKRLSFTSDVIYACFTDSFIQPTVLPQLNYLFAALLQLSHNAEGEIPETSELKSHYEKLQNLLTTCPQVLVIKELMIIHGMKNCPKWLRLQTKKYLTDCLIQSNGIVNLFMAFCGDLSDIGNNWNKVDVAARLIATSHMADSNKYYTSICSQILKILTSKEKHGATIANCCIRALYDYKPDVCKKRILDNIFAPFLVNCEHIDPSTVIKSEQEVNECIETMTLSFDSSQSEFRRAPIKVMMEIALPLFYLYMKTCKSVFVYRDKVKQFLIDILDNVDTRENLFRAFLDHNSSEHNLKFGEKLTYRFGPVGGVEVVGGISKHNNIELVGNLFELVRNNEKLSYSLFTYLLSTFPEWDKLSINFESESSLEQEDFFENIEKKFAAIKLLSSLAETKSVQTVLIKNPEPLLTFVKSLFKTSDEEELQNEENIGLLYTGLVLIKTILTDKDTPQTWQPFDEFHTFANEQIKHKKVPSNVADILSEITALVKSRGKSQCKYYQDFSVDSKTSKGFNKALEDLGDPLLPVRGHGIIQLTKLIDAGDPEAVAKRELLLHLFQENLKHEDSFIFLAAINGICSLSSAFPDEVISTLVNEFVNMPQRTESGDISSEVTVKLGEILVKTTRSLGEITPKYKNLLVNAFFSGIRDPDPIVRASSLSCLGEFCKVMGFRLGNLITEILYCIGCVVKTDKDQSCKRAGVLVATMLLQGLGKDTLTSLGSNLLTLYQGLKHLRDNEEDPVLKLHAQLALDEFDDVAQQFLFTKPKLEKTIFLLPNNF